MNFFRGAIQFGESISLNNVPCGLSWVPATNSADAALLEQDVVLYILHMYMY
jgi:hypothetical protein